MVDLLESVRSDIDERLKQLRPAVEESQKLEKALEALGRTGVRIPSEAESTAESSAQEDAGHKGRGRGKEAAGAGDAG